MLNKDTKEAIARRLGALVAQKAMVLLEGEQFLTTLSQECFAEMESDWEGPEEELTTILVNVMDEVVAYMVDNLRDTYVKHPSVPHTSSKEIRESIKKLIRGE